MANINQLSIGGTTYGIRTYGTLTIGSKTFNGSTSATISAADLGLSNSMHWRGVVASTADVSNKVAGDVIALSGNAKEYVYNGTEWEELGDGSNFVAKGKYKVTTSGTATPAVSVSNHTFTPTGNVEASFSGTTKTVNVASTVALTTGNGTANSWTPTGTVSFGSENKSISASGNFSGTVGTASVTFTPSTTTVKSITGSTASSLTGSLSGTTLTLNYTPFNITTSDVKPWTSCTATADSRDWSGTANLSGSLSVPTSPTFSGSSVDLTHTHSIAANTTIATSSYKAEGNVNSAFTGNTVTLDHTVSGSVTNTVTATVTVS